MYQIDVQAIAEDERYTHVIYFICGSKTCRQTGIYMYIKLLFIYLFVDMHLYIFIYIFLKNPYSFQNELCIFRPIKLVVAKCWDPNPKGYFTIPRTEPVRPIDPGAWVAHTQACRGIPG